MRKPLTDLSSYVALDPGNGDDLVIINRWSLKEITRIELWNKILDLSYELMHARELFEEVFEQPSVKEDPPIEKLLYLV